MCLRGVERAELFEDTDVIAAHRTDGSGSIAIGYSFAERRDF